MALPEFSLRQLLEAGCHFGHNTHRWNPKMQRYIFGKRNNVHIIDLAQTVPLLHQALKTVSDTVANGGRVLFVGTKRQASGVIADSAKKSAQYYVNHRWLGGTLTNWNTISNSIKRLRRLEETLAGAEADQLTKKERLMLSREHDKLERSLGGIKDMGGTPDLMFVIDTNKEKNAVDEARRLNIPVVAVLDTNCDPDEVNYPIPGNDDASRAIALYCDLMSKAALDGIARQQGAAGIDVGAAEEAPGETALDDAPSTIAETADRAAAAAASAAEQVKEGAAKAVDTAKQVSEDVSGAVAERAPDVADTVKDTAATAAEAVKETAASAAETVTDAAGDAAKAAGAAIADAAGAAVEAAKEAVSGDDAKNEAADAGPLYDRPAGDPDDLKKITGVGPVLEGRLNELGITKFEQIAAFKKADIDRVDERLDFKGRIERDDWVKQAKELAKA